MRKFLLTLCCRLCSVPCCCVSGSVPGFAGVRAMAVCWIDGAADSDSGMAAAGAAAGVATHPALQLWSCMANGLASHCTFGSRALSAGAASVASCISDAANATSDGAIGWLSAAAALCAASKNADTVAGEALRCCRKAAQAAQAAAFRNAHSQ